MDGETDAWELVCPAWTISSYLLGFGSEVTLQKAQTVKGWSLAGNVTRRIFGEEILGDA